MTEAHLFDPQTLYRHWEDEQWSPFAIDLDVDQEQWRTLSGEDRGLIFWVLSSLMVAEERITTKFSGLVGAYGSEEEATFLATQQVDEARHMQFYARFQDEVVADPAAIAAHVERAREQVSSAFRVIFDGALAEGPCLCGGSGDARDARQAAPRGGHICRRDRRSALTPVFRATQYPTIRVVQSETARLWLTCTPYEDAAIIGDLYMNRL